MSHTRLIEREGGNIMKHSVKITACLLLLLALCGCGNYEARFEGIWQGGNISCFFPPHML